MATKSVILLSTCSICGRDFEDSAYMQLARYIIQTLPVCDDCNIKEKNDEYVEGYRDYLASPPKGSRSEIVKADALIAIARDLTLEIKKIVIQRKVRSNSALAAVLKELDQKWIAIRRRLDDPEIRIDGFREFVKLELSETVLPVNW